MEIIVLKELLLKQKQCNIKVRDNLLEIMRLDLKNHRNHNLRILNNHLKKVKILQVNHNKKVNKIVSKNKIIKKNKQPKMKENNPNNLNIKMSTLDLIENDMI
jgi:hypothetical protein